MSRSYFSVATFNLRNLVRPGVTYYGRSRYSQEQFDEKIRWLAEHLYRMDADIVALQEVFHEDALEALITAYHALLSARESPGKARLDQYDNVHFAPNMRGVDSNPQPGLAILSRRTITQTKVVQDISDSPIQVDDGDGFSYQLDRLSRPIQMAHIDLGKGITGAIFNAHLKSKRPKISGAAAKEENALFLERAGGVFRSLALRAGEALALRREILEQAQGHSSPVIVLGDLNDEIGAVSTEIVAGEAPWRSLKTEVKQKYWDVELYSAARAHMRRSEHASLYTHIFNGHYGTIDHILVSQEFYYRNKQRIGDIHTVTAYNDHLVDDSLDGAERLEKSVTDHGQLMARLSIDGDRLPQSDDPTVMT